MASTMATGNLQSAMNRFQQYEVWQMVNEEWELVAMFKELAPASALAQMRSNNVRLQKVTYEGTSTLEQETLLEVGSTREQ